MFYDLPFDSLPFDRLLLDIRVFDGLRFSVRVMVDIASGAGLLLLMVVVSIPVIRGVKTGDLMMMLVAGLLVMILLLVRMTIWSVVLVINLMLRAVRTMV